MKKSNPFRASILRILPLAALALAVSPALAGAVPPRAGSGSLSDAEARRIALERVPGTVVRVEREREHGRAIVEVHVRDGAGTIQGVEIDDATQRIVRVEPEEADEARENEGREHRRQEHETHEDEGRSGGH